MDACSCNPNLAMWDVGRKQIAPMNRAEGKSALDPYEFSFLIEQLECTPPINNSNNPYWLILW
jgi:hypothetical protein